MDKDVIDLLKTATELVNSFNKKADSYLPQKIVDIVKLHSGMAVASSFIPVPGADLAACATAIWSMYIRINNALGLSFSDNVMKTIAGGVATNLSAYAVGLGIGSLLKFIPGIGTIGGIALIASIQYALTVTSGYVYMKALILLAQVDGKNIRESDLSSATERVFKDKSTQDFFNTAKNSYKK